MRRLTGCCAVSLAVVAALALAGPAAAAGTGYFVTIAARTCPDYPDITANKARNNIQESLRDLGQNTLYKPGELVNPAQELQMQPNCTPLTGFSFTFGTAIAPNRVSGSWGSLSVVSGAYATPIKTLPSVPDLNGNGTPNGKTIAGAVTIELTADQFAKAQNGSLWLQGGTPTDPVLDKEFPNTYAFGALRCSSDNVNGDNVEYAQFTQGLKSIYCFAYYVVPPPKSGTIVITKHVSDPANATMTFPFQGNISYTSDHRFSLAVANGADASMTFYRAETDPTDPSTVWNVKELVPQGWRLTGITCTKKTSDVTIDSPGVAISLKAGDTVHCTFTDALVPPPGRLLLTKVTSGGVDTFPMSVADSGGHEVFSTQATTTHTGQPAATAERTPVQLDPGTYTVSETLPAVAGGRWKSTGVICGALRVKQVRHRTRRVRRHGRVRRVRTVSVDVKISSDQGQVCQFTNTFVPFGRITIFKTTLGAVGTTQFTVTPFRDLAEQRVKTAVTTEQGTPVRARGDSTRRLRLGRYLIRESATQSDAAGDWELASAVCDGRLRAFDQGRVTVKLTAANPHVVCRFTNQFVPFGQITIFKTTLGGIGTTGFTVTPVDDPANALVKSATTTEEGKAALAGGDATQRLPLGRYRIQDTGTRSDPPADWGFGPGDCDGEAFDDGAMTVNLTPGDPRAVCHFTNTVVSSGPIPPQPTPTPTPTPTPSPGAPVAPESEPNLVITKRALKSTVKVGRTVVFRIVVRNAGEAAAQDVVVSDAPGKNGQLVSARPSQGTCDERTPIFACHLGTIGVGRRATIRVRVLATAAPLMVNIAVVGSGTPDSLLRSNTAIARVRARGGRVRRTACPARVPIAHAAC